jgi:PAS domain S-box-containing protein/diguanylate cyclase (GGDEF)-like protein
VPHGLRVLIVEDVAAEAELALRHLARGGLKCVSLRVDTEESFRQALQRFRPHIILSDFSLPGFDGLAALDIAAQELPNIPFIFLSGTIGEERAIEALRRGAVDYVLKTNPARLVPAVRRALREVSERARRRNAERQIRDSEQRLRDIVDTAQDWIWELDAHGRYVFSSESVRSVLGVSLPEVLGARFEGFLHDEDRARYVETLQGLGSTRRTATGIVARWRHADGEPRWLEGNLLALVGPDGEVTGFRGTHRDISERKQHQEHIARLTRMLQMQSGINAAVVRIRDRNELLQEACRLALQVGGYDHAMISLVTTDGRRAVPWYTLGQPLRPDNTSTIEFPIGDGTEPDTSLVGRALRTGEISVSADLSQSEPPVSLRAELLKQGIRSMVALPFSVDGARVGVLSLASREANLLSDEELRLLQDMIANLSFALQYRQKESAAQYLAYFDPLTGLAKRALFCERLDTLLKQRTGPEGIPTVVAFDVMHLSNVNDSFGRHVGDLLLQRVADRLKHHVEDDERLGYLGGGTFVLALPQVESSAENVTSFLESTVFHDVFHIEGRAIRTSFKSGIARFPIDGEDGNTLVQRAEAALKQAKDSGEQYLHYQIQMHSDIAERLSLEHRLRVALDEHQFVLHYQPQINLVTGRIESAEALLRWNDPQQGLMHPALFLPVLESSGMIVPVGEWVLHQAAQEIGRWRKAGVSPVRVAVNVSAQQIRRRNFVEHFLAAGIPASSDGYGLDIEITETGLLHDVEGASRKLRELRAAGMRVAIDDFGTGYSSLGLLSKLPVDLLKIDRSFISGLPGDRASVTLVSSIVGLASAFSLGVVAEGVETAGQLELLRRLKCNHSQGYLHSRPVAAADFERLLVSQAQAVRTARAHPAEKRSR